MTDQSKEIEMDEIEEPAFYKESTLNLISSIASWLSWVVLIVFGAMSIYSGYVISNAVSGAPVLEIIADPNAQLIIYSNILTPFFAGLTFFILLQAASIGLNVLYEIELGMRMPESK